ncbi:hypothetical protein [Streptomyces cremeus]|uniref:Uncharacterized protein n=1 Tax=Streptomyces cremeus TaxID=66881 RepID=A0ABV5P8T4_STRCM
MTEPTARAGRTWKLWLALFAACSTVVGLVVTMMLFRTGAGTTTALLSGGGAFATSLGLCFALPATIRELKRQI